MDMQQKLNALDDLYKVKTPKLQDHLTPNNVKDYVDFIDRIKLDDERAHVEEDNLYLWVLDRIALGYCTDPAKCAEAALQTQQIEFARWHA